MLVDVDVDVDDRYYVCVIRSIEDLRDHRQSSPCEKDRELKVDGHSNVTHELKKS
jgi:hypothetical protein